MSIKEDFDEMMQSNYGMYDKKSGDYLLAIDVVKWMAEKCASECDLEAEETYNNYEPKHCAKRIRKLASELQ